MSKQNLNVKTAFQTALNLITLAKNRNKNQGLLNQAHQYLEQAINKEPFNADYKAGMAQIYLQLGNKSLTNKYLKEALKLHSKNPLALEVKQELKRLISTVPSNELLNQLRVLDAIGQPESEAEYDRLYDAVETLLLKQVYSVMSLNFPEPTYDKVLIKNHKQFHADLVFLCQVTEKKLGVLEEDMDIEDLKGRLKPLLTLKDRAAKVLELSYQFQLIYEEIEESMEGARTIFKFINRIKRSEDPLPADFDEALEPLYDFCDRIADQLDHLFERQIDTSSLEPLYERMFDYVQLLQERLDELNVDKGGV